jgi:hypothetical protein
MRYDNFRDVPIKDWIFVFTRLIETIIDGTTTASPSPWLSHSPSGAVFVGPEHRKHLQYNAY